MSFLFLLSSFIKFSLVSICLYIACNCFRSDVNLCVVFFFQQETQVGTENLEEMQSYQKEKETSEKGQLTDAIILEHRGTITSRVTNY